MPNLITYGPAIQFYLANDPRKINPFNLAHSRFVPNDDPCRDALYLKGVVAGTVNRFYVTVEAGAKRNRYSVTIRDKHNENVVLDMPAPLNTKFVTVFGDLDSRLSPVLDLVRDLAASQRCEIRFDLANVTADVRETLERMHANVVDDTLYWEGVHAAQGNQPVAALWHDEQRRGWLAVNNTRAWSGSPQLTTA